MVVEFQSVEQLDICYMQMLNNMAEVAKSTNPDVLQTMVDNLMLEYKQNYDVLKLRQKVEKTLFKLNKQMCDKKERIDFNLQLRKMKFMCKQTKRANKRLFKEFKQQHTVLNVVDEINSATKNENSTALVAVDKIESENQM